MIRTRSRIASLVLALATPFALASCSSGEDDHGHSHGEGGHSHAEGDDHEHAEDEDHVHEGEPVVLYDGEHTGFETLKVTWLRTEELGDEIVVIVEATGGSATIRGRVRAADGAESLVVKADAEGGGEYHLHMTELPADLDVTTAHVVVAFDFSGDATVELDLPLTR